MQSNLRSVLVLVALLVGAVVGVVSSASIDASPPAKTPVASQKAETEDPNLRSEALQAAQITSQVAVDSALQALAKGHMEATHLAPETRPKTSQTLPQTTQPSVQLIDSAFALGVQGRTPQQIQDTFAPNVGQVWAWVRVANPQPNPTHVTLVWRHGTQERARVRLEVGPNAKGWRTWSSKHVMTHETGAWFVDVLDAQGQRVETLSFTVAPNA